MQKGMPHLNEVFMQPPLLSAVPTDTHTHAREKESALNSTWWNATSATSSTSIYP